MTTPSPFERIFASKADYRRRLRELPDVEKLRWLDRLHERARALEALRPEGGAPVEATTEDGVEGTTEGGDGDGRP